VFKGHTERMSRRVASPDGRDVSQSRSLRPPSNVQLNPGQGLAAGFEHGLRGWSRDVTELDHDAGAVVVRILGVRPERSRPTADLEAVRRRAPRTPRRCIHGMVQTSSLTW